MSRKPRGKPLRPIEELNRAVGRVRRRDLDDGSLPFIARLREAGVIDDAGWRLVLDWASEAARERPATPVTERGGVRVVSLDADPVNRDWLRIVHAWRLAGRRLPSWAALWVLRLAAARGREFLMSVEQVARQVGLEPFTRRRRTPP